MSDPQIVRLAFICSANAARSQMAEGFARAWAKDNVWVESAGLYPMGVSPVAIDVMAEVGIDISTHTSNGIDQLSGEQDFVITLCDHAALHCATIPAKQQNLHWPIADPSTAASVDHYRQIRDTIADKVRAFLEQHNLLAQGANH